MFSQGGAKKVGPWDPIVCVSAALTNECYHTQVASSQSPVPSESRKTVRFEQKLETGNWQLETAGPRLTEYSRCASPGSARCRRSRRESQRAVETSSPRSVTGMRS